jgi:elongation factor G
LSKRIVKIESMSDSELVEAVAETDDKLLEKYLETGSLSEDEIRPALKSAVASGKIYPLVCGSALNDKGIDNLLDIIVNYLPSPLEHPELKGTIPDSGEERTIVPKQDGQFCAFVFKTIFDPYVGQLTILRVFSGSLASNTNIYNVNKAVRERIGQIYMLQGKEQRPVDAAGCGDIVAIAKLKDTATSDTIGEDKNPIVLPAIVFPEPAISSSVKPKSRQDEEKISASLSKLSAGDPTFKVTRDVQTKELIISGVGDLHLAVMVARMKQRFNVEVELGKPKVAYKETITKTAKVQGKYKKQSGGRGQYGDAWIEVEPLAEGEFEFVDKIFGGAIPRNFIPSVEKGVRQAMAEGAVAGFPLVNIRVTLYDGSYHPVDSSDIAFQRAGAMALRKAVLAAGPVLLEPIMDVEVVVSDEFMGQISGDLNSRRGRIMGMEAKGKNQVVKAQVPLAEMFTYATDLRSITQGRGSYIMRFSHYEQVPQKIAQNIIAQHKPQEKEEE